MAELYGRPDILRASPRERAISAIGAAGVVLVLGGLLIRGLHVDLRARIAQSLALIDIAPPPPPPRPKPPPPKPKTGKPSGKASPQNLRAKATPVVAPPPIVIPPKPPPVIAAPRPAQGTASHSGASDRAGPGEGAGGQGDGFGSGGYGDGEGDGGGSPPRQTGGRLKFADLPASVRPTWTEGTVGLRYRVEANGRVSSCIVTRSSGNAEVDATTCRLIQQRFRFRPSRDEDGRPVPSWIIENQTWSIERDPNDRPDRDR